MKAVHTLWWGALAFASHAALAQMHPQHPQPVPMPDPQAQSDLATPRDATSGASDTSGASSASGAPTEAGMEFSPAPAPGARPRPQTQDDVTYLCGGVGEEEASYMKSEARGYDMMLTFAAQDGSYLANVDVDIRDAKGRPVLQVKCDSPIMLIDVPRSGTYRIRADAAGYTLNRTAKVTAKQKRSARLAALVLTWPQQVAEVRQEPAAVSSGSGNSSERNSGTGGNAGAAQDAR